MRFKKIYIEITNGCNLKCSFCIGNKRNIMNLTFDKFKFILDKVKPYTKYLYFHILGEPLLHPQINDFIEYAYKMGFYINITTNGYLINKLTCMDMVRQLNVSLHSYDEKYGVDLHRYLDNIFNIIDSCNNTFFSLRIWVNNKYNMDMINYIEKRYNINISINNNFCIKKNVYLSNFHEFIWPDFNNNYYCEKGKCYGLIDHIGILVDGTIIPCCLDARGDIRLGNIFDDNIDDVISSRRVNNMINGFKKGFKCEELCKHCCFLNNKKED